MAPRSTPRTAAGAKVAGAVVPRVGRPVRVPSKEDLELAHHDALLQLKIGRSATLYTLALAGALLFDGFLVLYLQPNVRHLAPHDLRSAFFLIFPVGGALYLSVVSLGVKWEEFQVWPWESHFSLSVLSVLLSAILAYLTAAATLGFGPTAHWPLLPWVYPAAIGATALPLCALALTWFDWTRRKVASVVAALLPVPIAFVLYLPAATGLAAVNAATISLIVSASLFQFSGSLLHYISSGTSAHEREMLAGGQGKLFALAAEIQTREDKLRAREAVVSQRQTTLDHQAASLTAQQQAIAEMRAELGTLEADLARRSQALTEEQQQWSAQSAEVEAHRRALVGEEEGIRMREQEVESRAELIGSRETRVAAREGEVARRDADIGVRHREVERREKQLGGQLQSMEERARELDRREGELAGPRPPPMPAGSKAETDSTRTQQLQAVLSQQNAKLGRERRELEAREAALTQRIEEMRGKEESVRVREAGFLRREDELKASSEETQRLRGQYEQARRRLESRLAEAEQRTAQLQDRSLQLDGRETQLRQKDAALGQREKSVEEVRQRAEKVARELSERERGLSAREVEVSVRAARAAEGGAAGPEGPLGAGGTLGPIGSRRRADRRPTGIVRLDDLLLGGFPPRAHVLFVGPPYIGKEVTLYAFLAEGLRRGERIVAVTATRPVAEISSEMQPLLPNLSSYEKDGKLVWIDASDPSAKSGPDGPGRWTVAGPSDHAGLLSATVAACNAAGKHPMRLGFLGLWVSLSGADGPTAFRFIQNLVGILKSREAIAAYTVDGGALGETMLESIESRMDGTIIFRTDRGKRFLEVHGLGEVETREPVEYRPTSRGVEIGSFALERIR